MAVPVQLDPSTSSGTIGSNKQNGVLRECPTGKVVVGVRAQDRTNAAPSSAYGILVQLDLLCGSVDVDADGNVQVTPDTSWQSYSQYDQGTGVVTSGVCPANTVAHRMGGYAFYGSGNSPRYYWASTINLACRPLTLNAAGELRIDMSVSAVTVMAGRNENTNDVRFHGWFCGTDPAQMITGYRPQYGGEGYDGINASCATIGRDFDDAPSRYGSASHEMNSATYLGSAMTVERASKPSADADRDDGDDGVQAFPRLVAGETDTYRVVVSATNRATQSATLSGWIDWNDDGVFGDDERVTAIVPAGTSAADVDLVWDGVAARTEQLGSDVTRLASRFRIGVGAVSGPTGAGTPGEVEDYMLGIEPMRPRLWIVKSTTNQGELPAVGERIDYRFTVGNGGNVTVSDIVLEDANVDPGSLSCPATALPPADPNDPDGTSHRMVCTGYHTVTQEDVDRGNVLNKATVRGADPSGDPVSAESNEVSVPPEVVVDLRIEKKASPTTVTRAGEVLTYTFTVTNHGTVTMHDVRVTDPMIGDLTCTFTTFAPGDTETCTGVHTVTQEEIDRGGTIDNVATVTGTPPGNGEPVSTRSEVTRVTVEQTPRLTVQKYTNTEQIDEPGQTISYGVFVTNSGNVTITDLVVRDPAADSINCEATTIAPGATVECIAQRTVDRDRFDEGGDLINTATAYGTEPGGSEITQDSNEVSRPIVHRPGIAVTKSTTADELPPVGEEIAYTYVVENTGNVSLTDIVVEDDVLGVIACGSGALAAGESRVCDVGVHTVTQEDVDRGEVVNTATARGTPPDGDPVSAQSEEVRVPGDPAPGLAITKEADATSIHTVGQQVVYTLTVRNVGNVTLRDVTVSDDTLRGDLVCPAQDLAPEQTFTCSGTYTVDQADLDRGVLENIADAVGVAPDGSAVRTPSNLVSIPVEERPSIAVRKSTTASGLPPVGETIEYSYVVTNTGNVPLHDVDVADDRIENVICPSSRLAAGASMTCRGVYEVTQADADAGSVVNVALASGTTPTGTSVTPGTDTMRVPGEQKPAIDVVKTSDRNEVAAVGEVITYTFTVRNLGNVTLSDPTVTDPHVADVSCPADVTLAPRDSVDCTGTYTVTQEDLDAGVVSNIAQGSATPPDGTPLDPVPSNRRDVGVALEPSMEVSKTAGAPEDVHGDGAIDAGDTIRYQVVVRNTGNVTLTDVRVHDPKIPDIACPSGALEVGAEMTCTGSYVITQADMDAGEVANRASASATSPNGSRTTPAWSEDVVVPLMGAASLRLVKSADRTALVAGETITYSFVVTNTGTVTLTGIDIDDAEFTGAGRLSDVVCPDRAASLAPKATVTCSATYRVQQADVDRGELSNTATAEGLPPGATSPVTSDPSSVTLPQDPAPALSLAKTSDTERVTKAGQRIVYTFLITNTGNVTVAGIGVDEREFGGRGAAPVVECPSDVRLRPGEQASCTAVYTVVDADLTGDPIRNAAVAAGSDPSGNPVVSDPAEAIVATVRVPLPVTGAAIAGTAILLAALLLLGGGGFVLRSWRSRRDASTAPIG